MSKFVIPVGGELLDQLSDVCAMKGSHLTMVINNKQLYFAVIIPEFLKIIDTRLTVEAPDQAVRIPKAMLRPILATICQLVFTIEEQITIDKYVNGKACTQVKIPTEPDFNSNLILEIIERGKDITVLTDLSPLINLKPMVSFGADGLQLKDNLAYIIGDGFIAYCKLAHPCNFVMSSANITELIKFLRANGAVGVYEADVYIVFCKNGVYFGCRQPVRFVDSMYSNYLADQTICSVDIDMWELSRILRTLTLPKGEQYLCTLNMRKSLAEIDMGSSNSIKVTLLGEKQEMDDVHIPLAVLKNLFSNAQLDYGKVTLSIYQCYVVFRIGGIDVLISRCDDDVTITD